MPEPDAQPDEGPDPRPMAGPEVQPQPPTSYEQARVSMARAFERYRLPIAEAPDLSQFPTRFKVKVNRFQLARFLLREALERRGTPFYKEVVTSRPCVYGTFGSPVGGFYPRPRNCVGCLRCVTEHPKICEVIPNPELARWGDSYLSPSLVETINHEASTGAVPVKGQGYRGRMGGPGWDGMWTDMSEIVRPTRDGIHGRETISTVVDIGRKQSFVEFDPSGALVGRPPTQVTLPLPIIFDSIPPGLSRSQLPRIISRAAKTTRTLAIMPLSQILQQGLSGNHLVPLITPREEGLLQQLGYIPSMIEIEGTDIEFHQGLVTRFPDTVLSLRLTYGPGFEEHMLELVEKGAGVFHLVADLHGRNEAGEFVLELIRRAHRTLVAAGLRDQVTLVGSGGLVAAEHVPKAIICGLDVVALNTPLFAALHLRPEGECADPRMSQYHVPRLRIDWGTQRLVNLMGSWRDQLLEIMGAMGLREVRRLRGEVGRAMFQAVLESEAFGGIEGYA